MKKPKKKPSLDIKEKSSDGIKNISDWISKTDVRDKLSPIEWEEFKVWICGKNTKVGKNGEIFYHPYDVVRFISGKRNIFN